MKTRLKVNILVSGFVSTFIRAKQLAKELHINSGESTNKFIAINCLDYYISQIPPEDLMKYKNYRRLGKIQ